MEQFSKGFVASLLALTRFAYLFLHVILGRRLVLLLQYPLHTLIVLLRQLIVPVPTVQKRPVPVEVLLVLVEQDRLAEVLDGGVEVQRPGLGDAAVEVGEGGGGRGSIGDVRLTQLAALAEVSDRAVVLLELGVAQAADEAGERVQHVLLDGTGELLHSHFVLRGDGERAV